MGDKLIAHNRLMPNSLKNSWSLDGLSVEEFLATLSEKGGESLTCAMHCKRNAEAETWYKELQEPQVSVKRAIEVRRMITQRWTSPNLLKRSRRWPCELYRGRRGSDEFFASPLAIDHTKVWHTGGRLICVTTEPYDLNKAALEALSQLCLEEGLAAYIHYGAETHAPGNCFAIVTIKAGNEQKLPTLAAAISERKHLAH